MDQDNKIIQTKSPKEDEQQDVLPFAARQSCAGAISSASIRPLLHMMLGGNC
jgi:hypothetical protein